MIVRGVDARLGDEVLDDLLGDRRGLGVAVRRRSRSSRRRSSGRGGPSRTARRGWSRPSSFSFIQPMSRPARSLIANGPIGEAEVVEHAVDVPRHRAFAGSASAPRAGAGASMRLPTKPGHTPTSTAILPICLASCIEVAIDVLGGLVGRARSPSSFMTLAGEKKCRPMTPRGRFVTAAISFDVQARGVGGQDRARLADARRACANIVLLDVHALEHGLDHEVARRRGPPCRASR